MPKLMLNTGLRLSEATALRWKDIDLLTGKLIAQRGKGAKDRTLWIGENDIDKLRHWRQRQVKVCEGEPQHVFTTLKEKPLQNRYVQAMLARYIQRAGINKNISPHTLRYTFATDLYRETGKIRLCRRCSAMLTCLQQWCIPTFTTQRWRRRSNPFVKKR